MRLGSQTVTRLRPTIVEDEYHNEVADWSAPEELTLEGVSVQPGAASEFLADREAAATVYTVWAPLADVRGTDRVEYDGTTYAIDGIERWQVGSSLDHMTIRLRNVEG